MLLISLAFMATGGFLLLHAIGTKGILFDGDYAGFKVAIPVGLLVSSGFAVAAAFVDAQPKWAPEVIRHRQLLRTIVVASVVLWAIWTLTKLPPLNHPTSESATGSLLSTLAALGVVVYAAAAVRFWYVFRNRMSLLPASLIACFVLLSEAMIGVAITGERAWHASWWLWHSLIVLAYLLIGFAARRQWGDERFRPLYMETTREHPRQVSVLFSDLAGFTTFTERSSQTEVAKMLNQLHGMATPLVARRYGGVVESLTGDGMYASFNAHNDLPQHALRAAAAGLALQYEMSRLVA
ncbi:MAG TPA: adenylate/guanylate cyclase domain-containing protein, partial [Candidatus Saccharimonas sp.]|nr:adenylate/guanylate cyclase domain-containing protein [Candidatus Saccharimonas sp.]